MGLKRKVEDEGSIRFSAAFPFVTHDMTEACVIFSLAKLLQCKIQFGISSVVNSFLPTFGNHAVVYGRQQVVSREPYQSLET